MSDGEERSGEPEGMAQATSAEIDAPPAASVSSTERPPAAPSLVQQVLVASLLAAIALFFLFSPWPLEAKLHSIGRACCAQIPSHTIGFGGRPLPIDARNSGIYLGVFVVIALLWVTGRQRAALYSPPNIRNLLMGLTLAMILDGFNSLARTKHLHAFYVDSNALRAITGTLAGVALTILVVPVFNRLVWSEPEVIPIASDYTELSGYLGGGMLVILTLLQAPAGLYWPMAIGSILGVLITLTMVNTCIILVSLRREHSVHTLRDLFIPALAGLTFTCGEIVLLNAWRVWANR